MSIDSSRKDFETVLEEMKEAMEILKPCIHDYLFNRLDAVVTEYEGHYVDDIKEMIDENCGMAAKLREE